MAKTNLTDTLKMRMAATQQASELDIGASAYDHLFDGTMAYHAAPKASICDIPMEKLIPFFTADIGFKPYPPDKLKAFAQQLAVDGQLERIIVRPIAKTDTYEILAGHNRTAAGKLNGWPAMAAEIVDVDDDRAITIATATNLLRRQDLTIIERGKAYKALLDAHEHQGYRSDITTSGEYRPKLRARTIVADFFGVTEYEIRKAVKLTSLIPPLAEFLENGSKSLSLACAEIIADYNSSAQEAFAEICATEGTKLNKAMVRQIANQCPPPDACGSLIIAVWRKACAAADDRKSAPSKTISFDRKPFQPYLEKLGDEKELERLFLEFLKEKIG